MQSRKRFNKQGSYTNNGLIIFSKQKNIENDCQCNTGLNMANRLRGEAKFRIIHKYKIPIRYQNKDNDTIHPI